MPGVTAGYSPNGTLLWEAFSKLATVWATALPNGDVCATGGYDALITCWRVSGGVLNQPPTAVMSATPSTGTAPLTVTFDGSGSTDPDGTVTSWAWSFGDGATGTRSRDHPRLPNSWDTYTASLTVTDNSGASSTATGSIVVNPPSSGRAIRSDRLALRVIWSCSPGRTIRRTRLSSTLSGAKAAAARTSRASPPSGPTSPTYTDYSVIAGQSYSYRVRAYNAGGYSPYSNIASIVAGASNQPPTAVMSATPSTGAAPLTVTFNGSGSTDPDGTIASYSWSFGDGGNSTAANPSHTYTSAGTYTATLIVTDNAGSTASAGVTITVTLSTAKTLRSTAINLSGMRIGSRVTVSGQVVVRDAANAAVSGVNVNVDLAQTRWHDRDPNRNHRLDGYRPVQHQRQPRHVHVDGH